MAVAIAGVGMIVAWRALTRSAPPPPQYSTPPTAPADAARTDRYAVDLTDPGSAAEIRSGVSSATQAAAETLMSTLGVTSADVDRLASMASERVVATLRAASIDDITAIAQAQGAVGMSQPNLTDMARARWEQWPELWRSARMSVEEAFVRTSTAEEGLGPPRAWQQVSVRNLFRPLYPALESDATLVEVVIPALAAKVGSRRPDTPVDLGFAYRWDAAQAKWVGVNVTMYHAAGVDVLPPP